jgi:hypothetical protein
MDTMSTIVDKSLSKENSISTIVRAMNMLILLKMINYNNRLIKIIAQFYPCQRYLLPELAFTSAVTVVIITP